MQIEESIIVQAAPETIYSIYQRVDRWHEWDPDTRSAALDGPFVVGTRGRLAPAKGREVPMELVHVVPNRAFTVECRIPMFRMVFEHELDVVGDGTRVTHRVTFSGPLTFLLGRMVGATVRRGLPITLASLKRLAESRRASQPATVA